MSAPSTSTYRALLREVYKASIHPRATRSKVITSSFREIFEQSLKEQKPHAKHDLGNLVTFMQSQRTHKELLERYNPLHDMTIQERIRATAQRVGLETPTKPPGEE